jgi:tellurite resistance protein TehA-like permease
MATAIVSVGLHLLGRGVLSAALLVIASGVWVVLAADFGGKLLRDRQRWVAQSATPPALTAGAGTTVLGVRLAMAGWEPVAAVLLVLAVSVYLVLMPAVMEHWRHGMPGAVFLVCVATQGLAVLALTLSPDYGRWLAWAALFVFFLGLALYVEALTRFDLHQVTEGAGDQWVAGGALAISALAASKLAGSAVWSGGAHDVLKVVDFVVLGLALAWYVVLAVAEYTHPRFGYDLRRWATVFPLGMTAVACLSTAQVTGVDWLHDLGHVLLWVAFAVWALTLGGLLRVLSGAVHPPGGAGKPQAPPRSPGR